jgi:uncharacterized protein
MIRIVCTALIPVLFLLISSCSGDEKPENYGKLNTALYLGDSLAQPLVVGLGGSEGGNAWTSDRWKPKRDEFLKKGYAFLALGYFGMDSIPEVLDRISVDAIHDAIVKASQHPRIDRNRIILLGGSKGAELALLMASYYDDVKAVIAIVPSHVTFPALTLSASTSSWMYREEEVPYVPVPWSAVSALTKRDLRRAFELMLEDTAAVSAARIRIEKIKGPIMLMSATQDEMWPSKEMSDEMVEYLSKNKFNFPVEHVVIKGSHIAPLDHFDQVFDFLDRHLGR